MGKKSRKGVSRAGAKNHSAAGQSKASSAGRNKSGSSSVASRDALSLDNPDIAASTLPAPKGPPPQDVMTFVNTLMMQHQAAVLNAANVNAANVSSQQQASSADDESNQFSKKISGTNAAIASAVATEEPVVEKEEVPAVSVAVEPEEKKEEIAAEKVPHSPVVPKPVVEKVRAPVVPEPAVEKIAAPVVPEPVVVVKVAAPVVSEPAAAPLVPEPVVVEVAAPKAPEAEEAKIDVWSSKLRDVVATEDPTTLTKPVMDVTPHKPSAILVSPARSPSTKNTPIPTLDTPHSKDVEAKGNECGCIIV